MISLQTLTTGNPRKKRKRVGRGHGNNWGRCCGRGDKGQMSRSGAVRRPHFEGGQIPLFRRLPKKGFNSRNHKDYALVNVRELEKKFQSGDSVDSDVLIDRGMIGSINAGLKILGDGELSKKLTITAHRFSAAAKNKIEAAGGTCRTINNADSKTRPD